MPRVDSTPHTWFSVDALALLRKLPTSKPDIRDAIADSLEEQLEAMRERTRNESMTEQLEALRLALREIEILGGGTKTPPGIWSGAHCAVQAKIALEKVSSPATECDGSRDCKAETHILGCFAGPAERSPANRPRGTCPRCDRVAACMSPTCPLAPSPASRQDGEGSKSWS